MVVSRRLARQLSPLCAFLSLALLFGPTTSASAQIFIAQPDKNTIGEYGLNGSTINASLVSGLNNPNGLAISGSDLFVANSGANTVGEYTTTGTTVNASLISGFTGTATTLAVSGANIFVLSSNSAGVGTIGEYTTTGTVVNSSLISLTNFPTDFIVSGSDLFVLNSTAGTVAEYSTSGTLVNSSLISGLVTHSTWAPFGIVAWGTDLFITNPSAGTVGEYTTSGGVVNASLISGLSDPQYITVSGSDLLISQNSIGAVAEYTTTGTKVSNSLFVPSGFAGAGMVTPVAAPEPSVSVLLRVSLIAIAIVIYWRRRSGNQSRRR